MPRRGRFRKTLASVTLVKRPPHDTLFAAATPFFNWLVMARGYNVRRDRRGSPARIKGTCR
jgi:hypothetical protein